MGQHKDRLTDEERKARRLESARRYREANREKAREAARISQSKRRKDPAVRAADQAYKKTPGYLERQRQYRAENRARLTAADLARRRADPQKYADYQRRYRDANPTKAAERGKKWREQYADKAKAYAKKWRQENLDLLVIKEQRRRARIKGSGGTLSKDIHARLMKLQRGCCAVCRTNLKGLRPHLDHIMPISRGGPNTDDNVQLLCPSCNLKKNAKHPLDFMREQGFLL